MNNYTSIIESLLYVVGEEGISLNEISRIIEKDNDFILNIIENLKTKYQDSGINLVEYAHNYKFVTNIVNSNYVEKLFNSGIKNSLSQSALETLAIIAYKQPITRMEIEELRGVSCEMMLRKLMHKNMIKELGRSNEAGRAILYGITDEFLDKFKLVDIDELPKLPSYENNQEESLFD